MSRTAPEVELHVRWRYRVKSSSGIEELQLIELPNELTSMVRFLRRNGLTYYAPKEDILNRIIDFTRARSGVHPRDEFCQAARALEIERKFMSNPVGEHEQETCPNCGTPVSVLYEHAEMSLAKRMKGWRCTKTAAGGEVPERVWMAPSNPDGSHWPKKVWRDKIPASTVEYIRVDLYDSLQQERDELKKEVGELRETILRLTQEPYDAGKEDDPSMDKGLERAAQTPTQKGWGNGQQDKGA
jgi:hypothetical protein